MGKWTTPKVVIDRFLSDQYVAACTESLPSGYRFIDIAYKSTFISPYEWGRGDTIFQYEEIIVPTDKESVIRIDTGFVDTTGLAGWHDNINFYASRETGLGRNQYTGVPVTFDVKVYQENNNWYATIYNNESAGSTNPSNHS